MHSIGIWELQGSGFSIRGRTGAVSQRPLPTDPGAWILAEAVFLLDRCRWEAETRLGSWESSVSGFSTSGSAERWARARHQGGRGRVSAQGADVFLARWVGGQQCTEDQACAAGFKMLPRTAPGPLSSCTFRMS